MSHTEGQVVMKSRRHTQQPVMQDLTAAGRTLQAYPDHQVRVKYATEHRCGLVVSGPGLSDSISGTDPLEDGRPLRV